MLAWFVLPIVVPILMAVLIGAAALYQGVS
jgi:hypothetical protein